MDARGVRHRLPLAGAAVAGAAVSHTLIYLVEVPDAGARDAVLAATGHAYWSVAVAAAVVLGLVAVGSVAARRFLHGLRLAGPSPEPVDRLALRLALYQSAIFVVQEGVERLAAGGSSGGLAAGTDLLLTGIAVQVLVALGIAVLLAGLGRAAEAVGRALRVPPESQPARASAAWPARRVRRSRLPGGPAAIRAPPLPQRG
ncbi:MAG TPA: hypothetical protein VGM21_16330 [Actinomycetota bacterium]